MDERPPGLYLKPPHGELSFTGAKSALAKARDFGIEGGEFTLCSGPLAWGEMVLGQPEAVGVDEFDARFAEHRVSVKEREKWWPDETELYLYAYEEWRPYDRPQAIEVPASVQTLMGPVKFVGEGEDMGEKGTVININTGIPPNSVPEDVALLRAMAGDPEAIAALKARGEGQGVGGPRQGDGGADKCMCPECGKEVAHEKGTPCADMECPDCGVAMVGKDEDEEEKREALAMGYKPWTAADAEGHTGSADTPAKQEQWASAANSHRKACLGKIEGTPTKDQIKECEAQAVRVASAAVKDNPAKEKGMEVTDHRSKQSIEGPSLSDITSMMWDALSPPSQDVVVREDRSYPNDVDVYDDYVTYTLDGKHYMRSYTVVDGKIQLGEPIEVEWIMRPKFLMGLPEGYKAELVQEFDALELGDKSLSDDAKAALTSAQRRALPETAFAWVETGEGCEKGEDGKRPLKCLHLPYKKADGELDCARVRNARGRIPQMSGVPQAAKDKIEAAQKKCTAQTATGQGKALDAVREQADKALGAVAALWKSLTGNKLEPSFFEGDTGLKVFEADDETWLLTWTTNAYEDRDGEIFSTASIEEYAGRAWQEIQDTGSKGQYDFWHAPGSEFADIKWVGAVGRFLVEMGTFNDDEVGKAFKRFFTECPEAQKAIAPDGWGASHRYKYRPWDRADGVYDWFDKDRTSVLAVGRAANPFTSMEVLTMLNDEQKAKLKEVGDALKSSGLDIDLVAVVESRGEEASKTLDAHVAHKQEGEEAKPADGKAEEGQAADEQVEAIAKRVASLMGLEELSKALQDLVGVVQQNESRLEAVEKGDLEKTKVREAWQPGYMWLRPSQSEGTLLDDSKDEDKDLKGKEPTVPKAIAGLTGWRLGQPQPPAAGGSA